MGPKIGIEGLQSFDSWKPDIRANYGGSDRKTGLISPDGARHLVKYSEKKAPPNDLATSIFVLSFLVIYFNTSDRFIMTVSFG